MRIGIITLFVTVCVSFPRPALCQDQPSGRYLQRFAFSTRPPPATSTRRFAGSGRFLYRARNVT
jgi:hypothetical protein